MYLEWIKYFLLSLVLLPVQLLAQVAPEEPVQDVDGQEQHRDGGGSG